jgi:hypothetical protein
MTRNSQRTTLSATLKPYDQVRVIAIRHDRFVGQPVFFKRHPQIGDVAVVVETHQAGRAFEVECSDPASGETIWLDAMYVDELATCES